MARRAAIGVTESFETFALEYLANGYVASKAYLAVHPRATQRTAEVEGSKLLRNPEVANILDRERASRKQRLQADGDEAIEGLTRIHRVNIKSFYKDGKLIPIEQLPDDVADVIKGVKANGALQLHDKLKARELLAINGGKIRQRHDVNLTFDHAKYLGAEPPPGDDV
jgi:Terminase small subunit